MYKKEKDTRFFNIFKNDFINKKFFFMAVLFFVSFSAFAQKRNFSIYSETEGVADSFISLDWKDSWLIDSPSDVYNHDLARVACVLSDSSYSNISEDLKNSAAAKNYRAIGVAPGDMEFHYDIDYSIAMLHNNQAACSFAHKVVAGHTLVFVTIRGTPSDAHEWISNITIGGNSGQVSEIHEGFYYTEREIHRWLIYYLLHNRIDPETVSFLITGHSRGAAVANLLGVSLADDGYFDEKKIYVYTFASPNISTEEKTKNERYNFIWNIVNPEDVVPTVPPCRRGWQYRKFGHTLTLFCSWTVDPDLFNNEYYPRLNKQFKTFIGRDYCPFKIGTFIPSYITRALTTFYSTVDGFYSSRFHLPERIESMFWSIFSDPLSVSKEPKKESPSLMSRFVTMLNDQTNGLVDYSAMAFSDMHSCKTYLSFLLAFDENEVYSYVGSTQVIIDGNYECAVFDKDGKVLVHVQDGVLEFKSIRVPVAAMYIPRRTVIAFPSNDDFTLVVYKDSILHTTVPIYFERYDSASYVINEGVKKVIFPHLRKAYVYKIGKSYPFTDDVEFSVVRGKERVEYVKAGNLMPSSVFRIQPEITFNSDYNFGFGLRAGTRNIYGGILLGHSATDLGKTIDLSAGFGHQGTLSGGVAYDAELYAKNVIAFEKPDDGSSRYNFVPEFRFSLSYKPFHSAHIFIAGILDLHIKDFNDGAFSSDRRNSTFGDIELSGKYALMPSLCCGLRF